MQAEFRYAKHIDLLYHVLAHMQVGNASDLFDPSYIQKMAALRAERSSERDLRNALQKLEGYYNRHFERLGVINFLPVYACGFEEMKEGLLHHPAFTQADREAFLRPFVAVLEAEAPFYLPYWEEQYAKSRENRERMETMMRSRLSALSPLFAYAHKSPLAYFSYSITRNGRGIGGLGSTLCAVVPFPQQEKDDDNTFFTLLHEYTHQLTDGLLQTSIHMDDGSHNLSENVVILFDYFLVASVCESLVPAYLDWIALISGHEGEHLSPKQFLSFFAVDSQELNERMQALLQEIMDS